MAGDGGADLGFVEVPVNGNDGVYSSVTGGADPRR
jgi:hypothetical protein